MRAGTGVFPKVGSTEGNTQQPTLRPTKHRGHWANVSKPLENRCVPTVYCHLLAILSWPTWYIISFFFFEAGRQHFFKLRVSIKSGLLTLLGNGEAVAAPAPLKHAAIGTALTGWQLAAHHGPHPPQVPGFRGTGVFDPRFSLLGNMDCLPVSGEGIHMLPFLRGPMIPGEWKYCPQTPTPYPKG